MKSKNDLQVLVRATRRFPDLEILVFGSLISSIGSFADLDLLVVYDSLEEVDSLASVLDAELPAESIDLTAMSRSEDRESNFRRNSGAVTVEAFISRNLLDYAAATARDGSNSASREG
ncbi:hypothetical protein [Agreia sp. Leaf244]|uniref:hypothetical protein n=1 Tax=Agreia sp. Leaf244 TaxID=1736305 RepID=UPI000B31D990|nr:hypothetical protein [Agreia sp. Leaf244]